MARATGQTGSTRRIRRPRAASSDGRSPGTARLRRCAGPGGAAGHRLGRHKRGAWRHHPPDLAEPGCHIALVRHRQRDHDQAEYRPGERQFFRVARHETGARAGPGGRSAPDHPGGQVHPYHLRPGKGGSRLAASRPVPQPTSRMRPGCGTCWRAYRSAASCDGPYSTSAASWRHNCPGHRSNRRTHPTPGDGSAARRATEPPHTSTVPPPRLPSTTAVRRHPAKRKPTRPGNPANHSQHNDPGRDLLIRAAGALSRP
jgi:hypothetical protein